VDDDDRATSRSNSTMAAEQSLAGRLSNTVHVPGLLGLQGVAVAGDANAIVSGSIANTVPRPGAAEREPLRARPGRWPCCRSAAAAAA
jgi:hypothetical protein